MQPAKPGSVSLLPPSVATHFPPNSAFVRYGTHGDGTCFFHSVCAARDEQGYLNASCKQQQNIGRQFRRDFTQHVTDAVWKEFTKGDKDAVSPEQARHNFRDSKLWANQPMIQFVASIMKLNLLFIDEESSGLYCGVHGQPNDPMIMILWVNRSHFEPVGVCRAVREGETGVQFVFDPTLNADVVDHVMGAYRGQCAA